MLLPLAENVSGSSRMCRLTCKQEYFHSCSECKHLIWNVVFMFVLIGVSERLWTCWTASSGVLLCRGKDLPPALWCVHSQVSLPVLEKHNLILIETWRIWNIQIWVSSVSRFDLCQFPYWPSFSFSFLASSLLLPFIFTFIFYFLSCPSLCLGPSFSLPVHTAHSRFLSATSEPKVTAALQCFTVNISRPCCSISLHAKPHCLDTGRCAKLCPWLSLSPTAL